MKRKHGVEGEGEERDRVADEEEEKINSFYTLVTNIRDAHDQVLTGCKEKGKEWKPNPDYAVVMRTPSGVFSGRSLLQNQNGCLRGSRLVSSKRVELPEPSTRRAAGGGKATREGEEK
ncbi:hypothetical protein DKX38_017627 [Salix brachista]|uniref:Uncharacterized protein n=1 Tax=Salix brachista TaxID=2182728 RepID=A0A5N5KWP1_9ROSI|nr:hypothetical protein DKX38_017627 [Salix brachista]